MHFSRLRLSGFKSFVDPTDFVIDAGLTGIVGPNGCGKSNLLESLRWVMGEASVKKMRGGEMDDVIFAGTDFRPGRNVAEVLLALDNSKRDAPASWNDSEELQISRKIERGGGSAYRINDQDVRARDVQIFFADIASGTKSSALVSQGQITDLIRSKPAARRHLLEEAARIAGLQSRRHEAELRLKAAETNLERLGDIVGGLEQQLANLQRQTRQAQRYRRLSDRIRGAEARWRLRRWMDACTAVTVSEKALQVIEAEVAEATRAVAEATTAQAMAADALPPLRAVEGEAGATLNELQVGRVALEAEERRLNEQRREITERLRQIEADLERERTLAEDAARALAQMEEEEAALKLQRDGEAEAVATADTASEEMKAVVVDLEAKVTAKAEERAARTARRQSLEARASDLEGRIARLDNQAREIDAERGQLNLGLDDTDSLDRLRREEVSAEERLAQTREAFAQALAEHLAQREEEEAARTTFREADSALARMTTERDALQGIVTRGGEGRGEPVLDSLQVAEGYETALGAALSEDLDAPLGDAGASGWTLLPPYGDAPALPGNAESLSHHVTAPVELARRLSQIGVVSDAEGPTLCRELRPGQRLVSTSGQLWRWDGYVVRDAKTGTAARLAQRARLEVLNQELGDAAGRRDTAQQAQNAAGALAAEAACEENKARAAADEAAEALSAAREARRAQESRSQAAEARRSDLAAVTDRISSERAELAASLATTRQELTEIPPSTSDDGLDTLRETLNARRADLSQRQGERDCLHREAEFRERRLTVIGQERQSWQGRAQGASGRIADLETRQTAGCDEAFALENKPQQIEAQRHDLAERLEAAEAARREATDRSAVAETLLAQCDRALRQADSDLSGWREERARREGSVENARQVAAEVARQIRERLETEPEALGETVPDSDKLAPTQELEEKFGKVVRERENTGPVNLRAEIEAQEVEEQLSVMLSEREDLEAAIQRLRRGIGELNREGRERLMAAFEEIDGHFQRLHKRLFGGHARLSLVDSDDPLEAGLEIEASPSGKKLQILSLLSGGEQALTALALIFALVLTNPSPVCVLDEVDAPLDDANVDRFCDLLDEFADNGDTRFLVITHHRLTMARMDRLFGVTMSEPGVSQLVSVDLAGAELLRATA